jgi:hypothetical protein
MANLALRRLSSAARPISCAHKTSASSWCFPGSGRRPMLLCRTQCPPCEVGRI